MCEREPEGRPSITDAMQNWRGPMPFRHKLALFMRNNAIKVRHGTSCCGNYGEPGC